jgi:hypothetical protein
MWSRSQHAGSPPNLIARVYMRAKPPLPPPIRRLIKAACARRCNTYRSVLRHPIPNHKPTDHVTQYKYAQSHCQNHYQASAASGSTAIVDPLSLALRTRPSAVPSPLIAQCPPPHRAHETLALLPGASHHNVQSHPAGKCVLTLQPNIQGA